jgi:hypothetical protein
MNNLKYIKLFEAFESNKLGKTLKYIEPNSKRVFMQYLTKICDSFDFPISEISDDYIDYLGFNKALKVNRTITDEICDAPSPNLAGEVCKDGLVKRNWGKGTRTVKCESCGGTGIKNRSGKSIKIVKFWFKSDGTFVKATGVDGIVRKSTAYSSAGEFDKNLANYTIGDSLKKKQVKDLQDGQIVVMRAGGESNIVTYIRRSGRNVYGLQDRIMGGGTVDRRIANHSWCIYDGDHDYNDIRLLEPKNSKDREDEIINPYDYNVDVAFSGNDLISNQSKTLENSLKDANFALILDLEKLKQSEFVKKRDTIKLRNDLKKDALSLMKDEDIKKENIKRYIDKLSKSINIPENITDLNKLVKRMIGHKLALFIINGEENLKDPLASIMNEYYTLLKTPEANKPAQVSKLNSMCTEYFNRSAKKVTNISKNIKELKVILKDQTLRGTDRTDELNILNILERISGVLYDRLSSFKIESIEDMEIMYQKLFSLRNICRVERYNFIKMKSFFESLTKDRSNDALEYLTRHDSIRQNKRNIIESLPRVETIMSKI